MPIALVTGANRGLGLEVAHQLADRQWTVLLTARTFDKAAQAAATLPSTPGRLIPLELDVARADSLTRLAQDLDTHAPALDALINNAAGFVEWSELPSTADLTKAADLLATNLLGPWRVTQALLPWLRRSPQPRVVMVASGAGSHSDTQFGLAANHGAAPSYGVSKAALAALTSKFAAELGPPFLVNAVCPGLTATAPGMEAMGARPVRDGAAGIVWAATLDPNGPTGGFFRDGKPLGW